MVRIRLPVGNDRHGTPRGCTGAAYRGRCRLLSAPPLLLVGTGAEGSRALSTPPHPHRGRRRLHAAASSSPWPGRTRTPAYAAIALRLTAPFWACRPSVTNQPLLEPPLGIRASVRACRLAQQSSLLGPSTSRVTAVDGRKSVTACRRSDNARDCNREKNLVFSEFDLGR